jgi:hypothetical protein
MWCSSLKPKKLPRREAFRMSRSNPAAGSTISSGFTYFSSFAQNLAALGGLQWRHPRVSIRVRGTTMKAADDYARSADRFLFLESLLKMEEFERDELLQAKLRQDKSSADLDRWFVTAIAELSAY